MKTMTIKLRITIWYTIFLTLLVALVLLLLYQISETQLLSGTQMRLQTAVLQSFDLVEYEEGRLDFDSDLTDYQDEGIYLIFYGPNGEYLYGRTPSSFSGEDYLTMDELREVGSGSSRWYVYDYCQTIPGYGNLWARGVASQTDGESVLHNLLKLALLLLPFLVLCIAFGGYRITRRALSPLSDMTETARRISNGKDLSQRIKLGPGKDEVHVLASTFDQMMDKLETSFENERQFTSDVSHELRTPVSVILSQCEYASHPEATEEEKSDALHTIERQSRKMATLISQLLTLSRADAGRAKLHMELLNVSDLAEITVEEQRDFAASRNITLSSWIQPDILMRADETMMMRLFINLLTNAITYGKEGGHVLLELSSSEEQIEGSVSDDGIGIPPEHLDKIWNRFYQVDTSRTSREDGSSGLGLAMVKWIVEAHGGTITVESKEGTGSRFQFCFPKREIL